MFTVTNVTPSGEEMVVQARQVSYNPKSFFGSDDGATGGLEQAVFADGGVEGTVKFTEGTVYVMNDSGKTVAKYSLKYPEPE
jgi:hypothetical protein